MRLIDAESAVVVFTSKLYEIMKTQNPTITATERKKMLENCYKVAKDEIDNIPTAYDLDRVVEELEEKIKRQHSEGCSLSANQLTKAIKIIKEGGKND